MKRLRNDLTIGTLDGKYQVYDNYKDEAWRPPIARDLGTGLMVEVFNADTDYLAPLITKRATVKVEIKYCTGEDVEFIGKLFAVSEPENLLLIYVENDCEATYKAIQTAGRK